MDGKMMQVKHNNSYDHNNLYDHNYGHKAADCRLRNYKPDLIPTTENVKVWKKKEDDKCGLVLLAQNKRISRILTMDVPNI